MLIPSGPRAWPIFGDGLATPANTFKLTLAMKQITNIRFNLYKLFKDFNASSIFQLEPFALLFINLYINYILISNKVI